MSSQWAPAADRSTGCLASRQLDGVQRTMPAINRSPNCLRPLDDLTANN